MSERLICIASRLSESRVFFVCRVSERYCSKSESLTYSVCRLSKSLMYFMCRMSESVCRMSENPTYFVCRFSESLTQKAPCILCVGCQRERERVSCILFVGCQKEKRRVLDGVERLCSTPAWRTVGAIVKDNTNTW